MSKRVLLTGGDGFIGSNVLAYLIENTDWTFTLICSWRHHGNPLNLQQWTDNNRVSIITHDLRGEIPKIKPFDYILHLASESHVDRSLKDPLNFIENNVSITLQVMEYARRFQPEAFLLFSTDEVYGANEHEDWDVLEPSSPYAASKAAQEMFGISYWKSYDLPLIITNSNNIVGPNQNPEKFVPKIIDLVRRDETVDIHVTDKGPGRRHWNPVKNVADALLFILNSGPVPSYEPGIVDRPARYGLEGGQELNNLQIAELVADKLGKKLKWREINAESVRKGYDEFYPKTAGKLTEMGWKPVQTLDECIKELVGYDN